MFARVLCAAMVCVATFGLPVLTASAQVQVSYFCVEEGDWGVEENWDCVSNCLGCDFGAPGCPCPPSNLPSFDSVAIIPSGSECNVTETGYMEAGEVIVESGATLAIHSTGQLSLLTSDPRTSTINGTLNIYGVLLVGFDDHTFTGSGKIVGKPGGQILLHEGPTFSITMTNNTTIEGNLFIGTAGEHTIFQNGSTGVVHANELGTIHINVETVEDQNGSLWKVSGHTGAILRFEPTDTVAPALFGDFEVFQGTLDVDNTFTTEGRLTHKGGKIDVAAGETATFSKPP